MEILIANESDAEAIRLYERLGFKIEGVRVGALKIDDTYEDIIEMAKKI